MNKIVIVDCGSAKVPQIVKMLNNLGYDPIVQKLNAVDIGDADGIIISGAPILLTEVEHENYLSQSAFIKKANVPVLGICFGHQLIGLQYGAKVSLGEEARDRQVIRFRRASKLLGNLKEEMEFKEDHCECISLPDQFNLIASSENCEVEMMEHQTKKIVGVQFHPEVSGNNGEWFFDQFLKMCKAK